MDKFFSQKCCDRCGKSLKDGRIMSMLNEDCICMECSKEENTNPKYILGLLAERMAVEDGNYNYPGLYYGRPLPK